MTARRALRGLPASPGCAAAPVRLAARVRLNGTGPAAGLDPAVETRRALEALEAAAADMEELAARLRAEDRAADAEIVSTGVLLARDPGLADTVIAAMRGGPVTAASAIVTACEQQAAVLASLPDPTLSARADDVRSVGRRAALLASPHPSAPVADGDHVLVADDLGPADVAELSPSVRAIALAGGGPTAHAAIVARSLGVPMVAGLGAGILALDDGVELLVDGDAGLAVVAPAADELAVAHEAAARRGAALDAAGAQAALPAETGDGHRITVLANVAGAGEVAVALAAGAEGVGLLRTELGFLDAAEWPSEDDHARMLEPVLSALGDRPATVRVLDFGGDKLPPFLTGRHERGVALLLQEPAALEAQLRAIVRAAGTGVVRVLVPMVTTPEELAVVRAALTRAAQDAGVPVPLLGPMIETPEAAARAGEIARDAGFLSIGTNDLTAATLGVDRFSATEAGTHDPRVLTAIARVVTAAHDARIPIEVCGEAASDPVVLPLLVGLGVDEISVGASRVAVVRAWVRALERSGARDLAAQALAAPGPEEVAALMAPTALALGSLERGEVGAHGVERALGVGAAGRDA
jgi:multiphosphoryl transfer protein